MTRDTLSAGLGALAGFDLLAFVLDPVSGLLLTGIIVVTAFLALLAGNARRERFGKVDVLLIDIGVLQVMVSATTTGARPWLPRAVRTEHWLWLAWNGRALTASVKWVQA